MRRLRVKFRGYSLTADAGAYVCTGQDAVLARAGAPVNLVPPTVSGTPQVGLTLTAGVGTWANASPPFTYQWRRAGVPISGATSSSYTLQSADIGLTVSVAETATNTVGSATAVSSGVGPVTSASQPSTVTTFTLTSAASGTYPWAFGHAFAQGDVPSTSTVVSDEPGFQATVVSRWPSDGSAKHAIIAGRSSFTASVPKTINIQRGPASAGTPVALSALQSAIVVGRNTVSLGSFGTCDLASAVNATSTYTAANTGNKKWSAGLVRQFVSGPTMSEWHFYTPAPSDTHLAVFWYVRMWATGEIEVEVSVENGWLNVVSPGEKSYRGIVTINGTTRYDSVSSLSHRHHTKWSGAYWFNSTAPEIVPGHNVTHLAGTKLVPAYFGSSPSASTLNALTQTYTPLTVGPLPNGMGSAGDHPSIGLLPMWEALYVTSGDARAYRATEVGARSYGTFASVWRDETTLRPARPTQYPELVLLTGGGIGNEGASGASQYTPAPSGTAPPILYFSHHPAPPYLAFMLTGRYAFWEHCAHLSAAGVLIRTASSDVFDGRESLSVIKGAPRQVGWTWRTIGMTAALAPTGDVWQTEAASILASNFARYRARVVDGTLNSGKYVNQLGQLGLVAGGSGGSPTDPGGGIWYEAPWQVQFAAASVGLLYDIGVPLSTAQQSDLVAVRNHLYKLPIGLAGDGSSGWCFRRAGTSVMPIMSNEDRSNPQWYASFAAAWTAFQSCSQAAGITDWTCSLTGTLLNAHDLANSGNTELNSSTFTSSNPWGGFWIAAAYARDHGEMSATAYNRMITSSTFTSLQSLWNNEPKWGVRSRLSSLPSWVPAAGAIANISLNTMESVKSTTWTSPTGSLNQGITAWTGAGVSQTRGGMGSVFWYGGGHNDYDGNDVYEFDISTRLWSRKNDPTPVTVGGNTYIDATNGEIQSAYGGGTGIIAALHTYNSVHWVSGTVMGNTNGYFLVGPTNSGGGKGWVHGLNLDTNTWSRKSLTQAAANGYGFYPTTCWDSTRNRMWFVNQGAINTQYWSASTGAWTTTAASTNTGGSTCCLGYCPDLDRLVMYDGLVNQTRIWLLDPANPTAWTAVTTNTGPTHEGMQFEWCPPLRCFAVYKGMGSRIVYKLNAPTTVGGTWTWTSETLALGDNPVNESNSSPSRAYSRFRWVDSIRCFVWFAQSSQPVQAFRLTGT